MTNDPVEPLHRVPLARKTANADEGDVRRMTGSSTGADKGSPYSQNTRATKEGDHRQHGLHTGRANRSK